MKSKLKDKIIIAASIIFITFLHYSTIASKWGLHDFYRRLYYIPIIFAAFRFKLKGGIIASVSVVILYAPRLLLYFGGISIDIVNQSLEIVMFIIVGTITGALVRSESRTRHALEIQILKLTELENYTQNILDSILNGVIAVDKNLNITSINKEGVNILKAQENNIEFNVCNFFEDRKKTEELLMNSLKSNSNIRGYETNCIKVDKTTVPVRLYAYPLKNIIGKLEGMVLIIEDISQVKKLESQIRRAEKLSAIGELASGIAHEIRNPLGIIKTISQTIDKDIEDEEIREGLEIIDSEIDRANKVIQGLLDFAKPSVVNVKLQSIDDILNDVLLLINKYTKQHNVSISYECVEDSIIYIDIDKLKQAFVNILLNAIQAMPFGGNIYIVLGSKEGWTYISFRDEGVGIEKSKLEKIFEPFFTTKEKGTGLGLSITHRIIEEHKGFIEIDSEIGAGTKLEIFLPQKDTGGMVYEENPDS